MKASHQKKQAGFTLIELVIIMAIIGVLGAVGAVKFVSMQDDANKAAVSNALANVRSALAIAIAKDTDKNGKASFTEVSAQLDGTSVGTDGSGKTFTWGGKAGDAFTVTVEGDCTNIQSISSVTTKDGKFSAPL